MLPRVPGIRRSWSGITAPPTSFSTKDASQRSPSLPLPQVAAASRPAISLATAAAWSPYRRRTSSTRLFLRRSPSVAADAPASPAVASAPSGAQARHVTSFFARFQKASEPFDRVIRQTTHTAGYLNRRRRSSPSSSPFDTGYGIDILPVDLESYGAVETNVGKNGRTG